MNKTKHSFSDVNPALHELLQLLKLDKKYHRAEGNFLYTKTENNLEQQYLDLAGGYGANLLGHNHPELVDTMVQALQDKIPVHAQLSVRNESALLAHRINKEVGGRTGKSYVTIPLNSGTEVVEAAIKHALMTYDLRINTFWESFERQTSLISVLLEGNKQNGKITFKGEDFDSFKSFYTRYKSLNEEIIKSYHPRLLAAEKAFHGKTKGSLSLTHRFKYREPFGKNEPKTVFFQHDVEDIRQKIEEATSILYIPSINRKTCELSLKKIRISNVVALFLEPIQGEGGVNIFDSDFLVTIRELTKMHGIPFILDEVQSGFYRTGEFLASFDTGVDAEMYTIGKSSGGSLVKISLLAIEKDYYEEEFGLLHTSTFAQDDLSSKVAIKALTLAKSQCNYIVEIGEYFKQQLLHLQSQFPNIITGVRGKGLMLGLQFRNYDYHNSYAIQYLSRKGYLGYLFSAYLLNNHNIRVSMTLSSDITMRLQPSMLITRELIDQFMLALEQLITILHYEDYYQLVRFMLPEKARKLRTKLRRFQHGEVSRVEVSEEIPKVAFLCHLITPDTLREADPSLAILNDHAIEDLLEKILPFSAPILLGEVSVKSSSGNQVHLSMIALPFTSQMCKRAMESRQMDRYIALCNRGADFARKTCGAKILGLGQYTSIVTGNGKNMHEPGINFTTGNSLTAYIGLQAIIKVVKDKGLDLKDETVAVIGAAGNISSVYAHCLSDYTPRLVLLGSASQNGYEKVLSTARNIYEMSFQELLINDKPKGALQESLKKTSLYGYLRQHPDQLQNKHFDLLAAIEDEYQENTPIKVASTLDVVKACRVVVVATNAEKPFLEPYHFSEYTTICDLSVPASCTAQLVHNDKHIDVIMGGVVQLPFGEEVLKKGLPVKTGTAFACISETMLLGLENINRHYSYGAILKKQVYEIGSIAEKHGFSLAHPKMELSY